MTDPLLTFDAEAHEYRIKGRRVPSVTQILQSAGLVNTDWFNEEAAWRGSVVHKCCELDCKGTLKESSVHPAAAPYLEAWREWKKNVGFTATQIEQRHFNPLGYAGTPDRAGIFANGDACDIDLKTGAAEKWHPVQLAAYSQFHPRPRVRRRFTVRLQADGKYITTEYPIARADSDWLAFVAALNLHTWRQLNGY